MQKELLLKLIEGMTQKEIERMLGFAIGIEKLRESKNQDLKRCC